MKPSSSFPYLKISNEFGVDYGKTLLYADASRKERANLIEVEYLFSLRNEIAQIVGPAIYDFDSAIETAIQEFITIQKEGWD